PTSAAIRRSLKDGESAVYGVSWKGRMSTKRKGYGFVRVNVERKASARDKRRVAASRLRRREERRQRVMVITEFGAGDSEATMDAMAEAILEYRRALGVLGRAVDLAKAGAPVALIGPGPFWRPRRTPEVPDGVPPAA